MANYGRNGRGSGPVGEAGSVGEEEIPGVFLLCYSEGVGVLPFRMTRDLAARLTRVIEEFTARAGAGAGSGRHPPCSPPRSPREGGKTPPEPIRGCRAARLPRCDREGDGRPFRVQENFSDAGDEVIEQWLRGFSGGELEGHFRTSTPLERPPDAEPEVKSSPPRSAEPDDPEDMRRLRYLLERRRWDRDRDGIFRSADSTTSSGPSDLGRGRGGGRGRGWYL